MILTQIQLPEEEYERLRAVANRQGRSLADCIREGIGLLLRRSAENQLDDIPAVQQVPTDDLKAHDRDWAELAAGEP
jgi:hypothetical protein